MPQKLKPQVLFSALKSVFTLVVSFSWFFWSGPKEKIIHLVLVHTVIFNTKTKGTKKKIFCAKFTVIFFNTEPKDTKQKTAFLTYILRQNLQNIQNNAVCWAKCAHCMCIHGMYMVFLPAENS